MTEPAETRRGWFLLAVQALTGFLLAAGPQNALHADLRPALHWFVLSWIVLLGSAAQLIEIGRVRRHLVRAGTPAGSALVALAGGLVVMLLGLAVAVTTSPTYAMVYAAGMVVILAKGVPPFRLDRLPITGWLLAAGFVGVLSPYGGWVGSGRPVYPFIEWTFGGLGLLIAALLPLVTIDLATASDTLLRYRLVRRLGVDNVLFLGALLIAGAFLCFARSLQVVGVGAMGWIALLAAALGWVAALTPWLRGGGRLTPVEHRQGIHVALMAYLATIVALIYALAVS